MSPRVSVIIPTHERPEHCREAIESVELQSRTPSEVIVVNDGSSRDYHSIRQYVGLLPGGTYERISQGGASRARNHGVECSTGDVLMFLDDDDRWEPGKIEAQLRVFEKYPDVGLVYTGRRVTTPTGEELYRAMPRTRGSVANELLVRNVVGITSSVAMRRSCFIEAGGFDERLPARQDYDLWIRASQCAQIDYVDDPLVSWTVPEAERGSISAHPGKYEEANRILLEKYQDDLDSLGWLQRRRAIAAKHTNVADKYQAAGSLTRLRHIGRSLTVWPSLRAVSKLPPKTLVAALRGR